MSYWNFTLLAGMVVAFVASCAFILWDAHNDRNNDRSQP